MLDELRRLSYVARGLIEAGDRTAQGVYEHGLAMVEGGRVLTMNDPVTAAAPGASQAEASPRRLDRPRSRTGTILLRAHHSA